MKTDGGSRYKGTEIFNIFLSVKGHESSVANSRKEQKEVHKQLGGLVCDVKEAPHSGWEKN